MRKGDDVMFIDFKIPKDSIVINDNLDEKIYEVVSSSFDKINDGTYAKWDIYDIKEDDENYIAVLKVVTQDELTATVETVSLEDNVEHACGACCGDCVSEAECAVEEPEFGRSVAYEGPWADKKFELDIAQISAFFEAVQFCDYMIKRTQMVTPVAARSLQECQKFVLENLTDFNPEQMAAYQENPREQTEPLEIKIKDEFAEHLKKWQEESVEIFQKLVAEAEKKPQVVAATMMPKDGFDPRGPGAGLK